MSEEIRLLLINTVRTTQNGQTMFLLNYLRHMDRSGMQVGFVAANRVEDWVRAELKRLGVELHELPMRNRKPHIYMRALRNIVRMRGYNVAHAHGNSATLAVEMMAMAKAGVPVRIVHSHNTRCGHPMIHRLLLPLMQKHATARFACGTEAGKWLFGDREFTVIRNASDGQAFRFDAARRETVRGEMGLSGKTVIGTVGSLNEQKNPLFLLDAFAQARSRNARLHLLMIGDGPLREKVEAKIRELHLTNAVTLTGRVNDVPDKLQAMDMMALPSVYEGFPCVLVEWQLNGLPALVSECVTADCNLTGTLQYLPLDVHVWAEKMAEAQADSDRAAFCARNAAIVAEKGYDIRTEAAMLKNLYAELLKEAGK